MANARANGEAEEKFQIEMGGERKKWCATSMVCERKRNIQVKGHQRAASAIRKSLRT